MTEPIRRPFGVKCVCMEPFPNMPCEKFLKPLVAMVSPFPAPTSSSPHPLSEVILRIEQLMPPLPLPLWDARFPAKINFTWYTKDINMHIINKYNSSDNFKFSSDKFLHQPERMAVSLVVKGASMLWLRLMPLISMCGNPNKSLK